MSTEPIRETNKTDVASLLQRFTSSLIIKVDAAEETMATIYLLRFSLIFEVIWYHLKEDKSLSKANFHQWALNTGQSLCLDRACDLGKHCGYTDGLFGAAGL